MTAREGAGEPSTVRKRSTRYTRNMIERTTAEIRQHRAEIDRIVRRWQAGHITLRQKQQAIIELNLFFYGDKPATCVKRQLVTAALPSWAGARDDDDDEREPWWQK